ncbi:MAG: sel1 repeat family protein [Rhodospirillaceae bacterium]|nr:sel1 repeat family protein [Rhodospirillaceae bacterium]
MRRLKLVFIAMICAAGIFYVLQMPANPKFVIFMANKGVPQWTYMAGKSVCEGAITEASLSDGINWISKAADDGVAEAQRDMSIALWFGALNKCTLESNRDKAFVYALAAATNNDVTAQVLLSGYFDIGTESIAVNSEKSFKWAMMAAKNGSALGQRVVARKYEDGIGVTSSISEARHWYEQAASNGDTVAKVRLLELTAHQE